MEFLRGIIGFIAIACAFMTGRTIATVRKGWHKPSRLYGWIVRLILCLGAVAFRHPVDTIDVVIGGLCAAALSAALIDNLREKKEEQPPSISPDQN
jgi:hypothetical protein